MLPVLQYLHFSWLGKLCFDSWFISNYDYLDRFSINEHLFDFLSSTLDDDVYRKTSNWDLHGHCISISTQTLDYIDLGRPLRNSRPSCVETIVRRVTRNVLVTP
jgi:hypothetical protein